MRHFLVPTDFSRAADNAVAYAALLAAQFDARITLVHIHPLPQDPLRIGELGPEVYRDSEVALEARAEDLRAGGTEVATIVELGGAASSLKRIIARTEPAVIVMGCQGRNYLSTRLFGRTTVAIIDAVNIPVLAVPLDYTPAPPRRPLWAADGRPPLRAETLYPLYDVVDRWADKLLVFHYQQKGAQVLPEGRFREILAEVRYDYYVRLHDGASLLSVIGEFAERMEVDLIAMIHRRRPWLRQIAGGSHTQRMVGSLPVPLLILQEADEAWPSTPGTQSIHQIML